MKIKKIISSILILSILTTVVIPTISKGYTLNDNVKITLSCDSTKLEEGSQIILTINSELNNEKIDSIGFTLNYDTSVLSFNTTEEFSTNTATKWSIPDYIDRDGSMMVTSTRSDSNSAKEGIMFTCVFDVLKTTANTQISIDEPINCAYVGTDIWCAGDTLQIPKTAKVYTIKYNSNTIDTVSNMASIENKIEGNDYTIAQSPIRTGYTFAGWNTLADGTGTTYAAGSTYTTDANLELYAQWNIITTTLTVNPNGGTWEGSSTEQSFSQGYGTTKTISSPTVTPNGCIIRFNANGGTASTLQITQTKTFNNWALTGGGQFNSNIYTFADTTATLTASYTGNSIVLPEVSQIGKNFKGWYTAATGGTRVGGIGDSYTPTEGTTTETLSAQWENINYDLTINPNGGKWNETTENTVISGIYNSTTEVVNPTVPTDGYTVTLNNNYGTNEEREIVQTKSFDSWTLEGTGSFEGTTYTYGAGNGTLTASYISNNVTLPNPEGRIGYTFDGWYTEEAEGTKVNSTYMPTGDVTLYAHWKANKYTVTFNPGENGTVDPETKQVTYGETYGTLPIPEKVGHTFKGWYNGETKIEETTIVDITNATTLTARWLENTYIITFNAGENGTVNPGTKEVTYGETYGTLPTPEKVGYTFKGWYTAETEGTKIEETATVEITEATTIYAQYEIIKSTLTVNPNGGKWNESTETQDFEQGYATEKEITNPTVTPNGYTVTLNENYGENDETPTIQTTSFDKWTLTGAGSFAETTYTYGTEAGTLTASYISNNVTLLDPEARTGYTFDGWYTQATEGTKVNSTYMPTGDVTLYAHWIANKYTVTFNAGENGTVDPGTKEVTYGETYGTLPIPEKVGYTFKGWYTAATEGTKVEETATVEITEATTIYAQYEIIKTTLTVNPNGGKWNESIEKQDFEQNYATEKEITNPTITSNGYIVNFNTNGGTSEISSITQTTVFDKWTLTGAGSFEGTTYTYGTEAGTLTASYIGNEIILPEVTKEGTEFKGWYTESIGGTRVGGIGDTYLPTAEITLYAQWNELMYTLTVNPNGGKWNESTETQNLQGGYNSTKEIINPTVTPNGYTVTLNENYGENVETPIVQTKSFDSWTLEGTGNFEGTTYTYGAGNGTLTASYISNNVTLPNPEGRIGYTFDGWYTEEAEGTKVNSTYMPTGDVTLYAHWIANKYTVTFNAGENGTVDPGTKEVTYGETYGTLPTPEKVGYTFKGWYTAATEGTKVEETATVEITEGTTIYAQYEIIKTTLTVNPNGGKWNESTEPQDFEQNYATEKEIANPTVIPNGYTVKLNENYGENVETQIIQTKSFDKWTLTGTGSFEGTTYTYGAGNGTLTASYISNNVTLPNPEGRIGYIFDGWYTEEVEGTKVNSTYMPTGDVTLYAHWIANKYTITLDAGRDGGIVHPSTYEVTYGQTYGDIPKATKYGYTFKGWYTAETEGTKIENTTTVEITEATTIYAQYEIIKSTLTVNPNGGTWNENTETQDFEQDYATEKEIANPVAPQDGYIVTLDNNYTKIPDDIEIKQTKSFDKWILTGEGKIEGTTYTYGIANGILTASYKADSVILPDPEPRIGYTFEGWGKYTTEEGIVKVETPYTPTENITLCAMWKANEYMVTFDTMGGTEVEPESIKVEYNSQFRDLPETTKYGYTFKGWYTAAEGGNKVQNGTPIDTTSDITLYAQYDKVKAILTVNPNGGTWNESTETQDLEGEYDTTKEINVPEQNPYGYKITLNKNDGVNSEEIMQTTTFDKWTLTGAGNFEGTTYTYGIEAGTLTASYISNNVTLPEPERPGYRFDGWYTLAEGGEIAQTSYMPTEDVTLYAHWIANKYIISFVTGEGITVDKAAMQVTYGNAYGELPIPEATGYDFEGWYDERDREITEDSIVDIVKNENLYAVMDGMTYKVTFDYNGGEGTVTEKEVKNNNQYEELPEATKAGYTFIGWYKEEEKVTEDTIVKTVQDITLQARYERNKYNVTFYNDDGTTILETMEVEEGNNAVYTKENPTKTNITRGYTAEFTGWDKSTENIVQTIDIIAQYTETPIEYSITYNDTKDSENSENPITYTVEDENIELKDLEKQNGEIFIGWYIKDEENQTEEKVISIDTSKLENIVLYAKWEKEKLYLKSEKYKIGENDIDKYEEDDIYFDKIEPNTKVSDLINNCETNGLITIINKNGEELDSEAIVGTDMTLKVTKDEEEITLTTIVMGDLDGNGIVTATDLSTVNQSILKTLQLNDIEFKAANLDDNDIISATDLSTINSVILKILTLKYDKQG